MQAQLTTGDTALVRENLALLARAGVRLAEGIEPDDVEDAVADELASFRAAPLTTLAGLEDPDGAPLLAGAVLAGPAGMAAGSAGAGAASASASPLYGDGIAELVQRYAGAAGAETREVAVVPDPETAGRTGSVRIRFGEWDVADVDYDFAGDAGHAFELDVLAAALPLDASAATFPTPDGRDATLFIPSGADAAAVDELFAAIEAEFGA